MTNRTIRAPELAGSREQARDLMQTLVGDLRDVEVIFDCSDLRASAPSFVDELVKIVLVERNAARLLLVKAPPRAQHYARRSAANRSVGSQLGLTPLEGDSGEAVI